MKKQYINFEDELEILSRQLDAKELYILAFLKGFTRKQLKEWGKKGLLNFSVI